ncbi:T9SS type B sorting domain-containing protein [Leptobacterium flavescens]|uniref:T9SS type B sorting domain-containing protein n=1 Tax=Leptobacterium flavescens TaxID=472055 RepID=A0A6P0UGD1_9FLAO|nr:gliding motility-associated C-terminal domain-containing protein [Leptobacterium flavescens]NER12077.1 T9SS type B sorting domain-containing protein [Leptobacterium flavescens]
MMKKQILFLCVLFLFGFELKAQCGPGQDTEAPVFDGAGNGTLANPFTTLLPEVVGSVPSGTYYFNFNGNTFQGVLDNDTDGGGWLMILNYVHQAGDNSALTVRNTDLPLLGSSTLGHNEAGSATWGHFGNQLAAAIDFAEMRFYGATTGHSRVIDFKTSFTNVLEYVKTGNGSFTGISINGNFTALAGHNANIPAVAFNTFTNQGDLALTEFPFWRGGRYHWGIRGLGNRWEVDDFSINAESTIHRVWVRGDLSPLGAVTPTVQLDANGIGTISPSDFGITASDNCGNVTLSLSQTSFDCTNLGENTVQLIATDDAGNSREVSVRVIVEDQMVPVAQCVAPFTVTLDAEGKASITVDDIDNGSTDNCDFNASINRTQFDCNDLGDNIVTLTVADMAGNVSTCSTTVTVNFNCPSDIVIDNDPGQCGAVVNYIGCSTLIEGLPSGSLFPIGTTNNVFEITDSGGNTVRCSFSVTVNDTEAPSFSTRDLNLTLDASGTASITTQDLLGPNPLASDYELDTSGTFNRVDISANGTVVPLEDDEVSAALPIGFDFAFYGNRYTEFYISSNGFITFSDEGEDGCCSGDELPDTNEPNNMIAFDWTDINPEDGGTIRYTTIGTAPNRILIVDFDEVAYYDTSPDPTNTQVKLFEGSNRIEIHSTTLDSGNDKTQGIENIDGTAAVFVPGRNAAVWTTTNDYVAFAPKNGISENCAIDTIEADITTFDCSNLGDNIVTLTVTDVNGNSSAMTAVVTVDPDPSQPLVAIAQDITVQLDADGQITIDPAAIDNGTNSGCNAFTLSLDRTNFNCNDIGDVTVTLTATEGNVTATDTAVITIEDTTAPTVITRDITVELDANGNASITPQDVDNGTNDACSGTLSLSLDQTSFSCPELGEVTVTLTATDSSGNSSTGTAIVTFSAPDRDRDNIADTCDDEVNPSVTPNKGFSPNDDGNNDSWTIENITDFPQSIVQVFDRNGREVFKARNYQNDWRGNEGGRGSRLPVGAYYYSINVFGDGSIVLNGWIYINY